MNTSQHGAITWNTLAEWPVGKQHNLLAGGAAIAIALSRRCRSEFSRLLPSHAGARQWRVAVVAANNIATQDETAGSRKPRQWPAEIHAVTLAEVRARCADAGIYH